MTSRILSALKNERVVTLAAVKRGEEGLTCPTCGDRLAVKDGGGRFVKREGRRHQGRGKHFSHIANSGCHGEGPAHFRVKTSLCRAINHALEMPRDQRNAHGRIAYLCPDPEYGPHDALKWTPGSEGLNREFKEIQHGYHDYDLLRALDHAECERWLDGRRTRADITGFDKDSKVLWVIEIDRSGVSQAAIDHAREKDIPLFVVDLTRLPKATDDDPLAEIYCEDYFLLGENLIRGFYPSVTKSYNTKCERRSFGMGPTDQNWSKMTTYIHRGTGDCNNDGCSDCEKVVLHECGELFCPDTAYMFEHGIGYWQMYTDPVHKVNSHVTVSEK